MVKTMETEKNIDETVSDIYRHSPLAVRLFAFARIRACPMLPLLAEVPPKATVLDIGCGNGLFLLLLAASGKAAKGIGIDCKKKLMEEARGINNRFSSQKHNMMPVDFITVRTPQDWPVMEFSCVSMIDVMHHIPSEKQRSFFFEAARRVGPGGVLLYKDMCVRPLWRTLINRMHDFVLARQWIHYVSADKIKNWAKACGLELEKETHYSKFVSGHEKLVFKRKL